MKSGNEGILKSDGRIKISVVLVAALLTAGALSVFVPGNAKASAPTWIPPIVVQPSSIALGNTFSTVTNFTHANSGGDQFAPGTARIWISASPGTGCTGTSDVAQALPMGPPYTVYKQNYDPSGAPFSLGPGDYKVYLSANDTLGNMGCSGAGDLTITAPDTDPPNVAAFVGLPPPNYDPYFTVDPASTTTDLKVIISDATNGGSKITDGEYFYCAGSSPCGPNPAWVNDAGTHLVLDLNDPWIGGAQSWDSRTSVSTTTTVDVSAWAPGTYWFYIHGADCGQDSTCQGGTGDDNWGDFKIGGQKGTRWFELSLSVGGGPGDTEPPETVWVTVDGADMVTVPPGQIVKLEGLIDDKATGNSNISSANYTVGPLAWPGTPMDPVTPPSYGMSPTQLVALDVSFMIPGTYVLYVYGCDVVPNCNDTNVDKFATVNVVSVLDTIPPEIYNVLVNGQPSVNVPAGTIVTLTAMVVDMLTGNSNISSANYTIGSKAWGTSQPMNPVIPPWDNPLENVTANVDTTGWAPGNYDLYVYACDEMLNCNLTSVEFATITISSAPPPNPPANLRVIRSTPNIQLTWSASAGANNYSVYYSTNRFAPIGSWTHVSVAGTTWTHTGAYSDLQTWFYVVRAFNLTGGLSANSDIGSKNHSAFGKPFSNVVDRNVYWISLPYNSMWKKASDIVLDIEGSLFTPPTKINMVCKWNAASQNSVSLSFSKGRWRGTDFAISAGDGICLNSINSAWSWIVNGTDSSKMLSFNYNAPPKKNINWFSMPPANNYANASQMVLDIEGSLVTTPTKVTAVAIWNAATQSTIRFYWSGSAWTGTDFVVYPGMGYHFDILSTFTWTPDLIAP